MALEIERERIHFKEEPTPQEEIWKYIFGFIPTVVVKCAIELGIPDILDNHENPMTLAELTSKLGCNESSLYRIMRFLTHYKIFQEKPVSETSFGYTLTPLSRLLTRKGENSMADMLLLQSSPFMLAPWQNLSAWVLENKDLPFEAAHNGKDIWGYTASNLDDSKLFDNGMASDARVAVAALIKGCPEVFDGLKTMVDVGGGDGTALRLIVKAFPSIKGINYDLPHVVSMARAFPGVEHVGGNMFDHVPKADAAYLMKLLHDWRDEECIEILKKCREAIPQDIGKVIIVEAIIGRKDDHEFKEVGLMLDMVMMAHSSNGKERTMEEWSSLFHEAGFTRYTVKHIRTYHSIIELFP